MFSIILQTARGILKILICVVQVCDNFNGVFHKKGFWNLLVLNLPGLTPVQNRQVRVSKQLVQLDFTDQNFKKIMKWFF